jgi:hypothetical protein
MGEDNFKRSIVSDRKRTKRVPGVIENRDEYVQGMDTMEPLQKIKPMLVYTMTSGLGDFIVLGDLIGKIEKTVPDAKCLIIHRDNPHVSLWQGDGGRSRFFSVFSLVDMLRLYRMLSSCNKGGYTIFGIQMAPGSLQGFFFFRLLKKLRLLHYIVDFNLINADIITSPKGDYILDMHLNQAGELLKIEFPAGLRQLDLPLQRTIPAERSEKGRQTFGIHPWSRRGHLAGFVWPFENWLELIRYLLTEHAGCRVLVFGRDKSFDSFKCFLRANLGPELEGPEFSRSNSVSELVETIAGVDVLVTVNTAVIHIGYALQKKMFILNGPSLELWVPKGDNIHVIRDKQALFQSSDNWKEDGNFGSVGRIEVRDVIEAIESAARKYVH